MADIGPVFRVPADHSTIASALACAAPRGGKVIVSPGTYQVDATLLVSAGVSLEGVGEGTVLESAGHTVILCADGALRVANMCILQVSTLCTSFQHRLFMFVFRILCL